MRSTNREIRLLLKLLRRPHALECDPLAIMLREALQAESAQKAVLTAIESAFDTATANGRLLKEIIQRCDIGGQTTRVAAADLHFSRRQFFRHRIDAVEAIARWIGRTLRQPDESARKQLIMASMVAEFDSRAALEMYIRAAPAPSGKTAFEIARAAIWAGVDPSPYIDACEGAWRLLALANQARRLLSVGERAESESLVDTIRTALAGSSGPLYDGAAFEIAELDRRALRRRGIMHQEMEIVGRMGGLARDDSRLVALTLLAQAEAACSAGDLTAAATAVADAERIAIERRNLYVLARAAYASASVAMLRDALEDALALFNAAASTIAAFDAAYSLRAAAFAGRSALLLGRLWSPPKTLMERHAGSWILTELECVEARRLVGIDPARAVDLASSTLHRAQATDATVATLYARATVAAALDKAGDSVEAKKLWLLCWAQGVRIGDHSTLFDLFVVPNGVARDLGPLALDDDLRETVQRFYEEQLPVIPSSLSGDARRATSLAVSWLLPPTSRSEFRASFDNDWARLIREPRPRTNG